MMKKIPKEFKGIVNDIFDTATNNGIKVEFVDKKLVTVFGEKSGCKGYFIDLPKPKMVIATGNPFNEWILVLIHEGCHMEQFIENNQNWSKLDDKGFWDWVEYKKELTEKEITRGVDNIISLEIDCEKRVIDKIIKYNLPIDTVTYIQKANSYVYSYYMCMKYRTWIPGIYNREDVYKLSPKKFRKDYSKIPKKLRDKLEKIYSS